MTPVLFHFLTPTGLPLALTPIEIQLSKSDFDEEDSGVVMPRLVTAITDADGKATVNLWPHDSLYYVTVMDPNSDAGLSYKFYVPEVAPGLEVRLQDIVVVGEMSPTSYDEAALLAIQNAKALTLTYKVAAAASAASASASEAASSATLVSVNALAVAVPALAASAEASKNAAAASASSASTSASAASTSQTAAATSAATATTKASEASASSASAAASQTSATGSASTATTAAGSASTSATAANNSALAAAASSTTATTQATTSTTNAGLTAADRVQTGLDRVQTGADRVVTSADRAQSVLDAAATAADRVVTTADKTQTGLDRTATAADRVQTGLDRTAAAASAATASTGAVTATTGATTATTKAAEAVISAADAAASAALAAATVTGVSTVNTRSGAVVLTSADVGLGNANNTSDANKPVSTAQATANTAVQTAAATDATTKANAAQAAAIAASTPVGHIGSGGVVHANAVAAGAAGFMTGADKTKLDTITGTNTGDETLAALNSKLGTNVCTVRQFDSVGDGTADDTAAFVAAMASLGPKGGRVYYYDKHLIDSTITVPAGVCLVGPYELAGIATSNTVAPYGSMSALILNSAATINLSGGAGISGSLIYRKGMTFPAADSSAFAGTAITAAGDDTYVTDSMVLGFNMAYYSTGKQRPTVRALRFDCNNGIEIVACYDIARVSDCHGWPFATIAALGSAASLQRSGNAYKFLNGGDWNMVTNCFSYGYYRGFYISTCNAIRLLACGVDSTGGYSGQIGFVVDGISQDTLITSCQAAAQQTGYYIGTSAGNQTQLTGCVSWACTGQGVLIDSGDVNLLGGIHRNTPYGVIINNSVSNVFANEMRFKDIAGQPFYVPVTNANIFIGDNNDYSNYSATGAVAGANKALKTAASADPLLIDHSSSIIQVSGTTSFGNIAGGYAGREVTLLFTGVLTVFDGGANLKLNGNLVTAANTALTLVHTGSYWIEKSRSVN